MPTSKGIDLRHLDRMTDSTGLIQHAIYSVPRRESGYTIDDNARALRLCVSLWAREPDEHMLGRIAIYLSLLEYARRPGGGFHNLMSYQRQWLGTDATGDCQGQAVRALAEVLASPLPEGYRMLARELIDASLPTLAELRSLRAQAYVVLAAAHLRTNEMHGLPKLEPVAHAAARHLVDCYQRSKRPGWHWYESRLTYANAVLPHAMYAAASIWPDEAFLPIASESFAFLARQTARDGVFWPIGNNGWFSHGEPRAEYDQQPIEAVTMADAALAAHALSPHADHLAIVRAAHEWFDGKNSIGCSLVDVGGGACCDGLQANGVNRNQGAESTLAHLWAQVHLHDALEAGRRMDSAPRETGAARLDSGSVSVPAEAHHHF